MSRTDIYAQLFTDSAETFSVRRLQAPQTERLATVLSQTLLREPDFKYMLPDERLRLRFLNGFLRTAIISCQLHGEILTTADGDSGCLWIGPKAGYTRAQLMRTALASAGLRWEWAALRRCMTLQAHLDWVHRQLIQGAHWHLLASGVASSGPIDGAVSAVMEPLLVQADSAGLPCYLETFNEEYLSIYKKCGFRIAGSGKTPKGGPDFWAMIRTPQKRRSSSELGIVRDGS